MIVKLRRVWHEIFGHDIYDSERVESQTFRLHPQNSIEAAYAVNLMHCPCGRCWLDAGFESRVPHDDLLMPKPQTTLTESVRFVRQRLRNYDE